MLRHPSLRSAALLAALALAIPALAHAQAAKLRVVVKDESTGAPVAKAEVALVDGAGRPVFTDSLGQARFSALPAGKHALKVTRQGYSPHRVGVELSPGGELELEVALALAPVALPVLDVRGVPRERGLVSNGFYRRKEQGGGTFLDWNDLERWRRGNADIMRVIRYIPGFDIQRASGDTAMLVLSSRGPASLRLKCRAQFLLDGNVVSSRVVSTLTLEQIAGIEGYPGPASTPAIFNHTAEGTTCGTIAVWTRRGDER